jgi:hypothetical protein
LRLPLIVCRNLGAPAYRHQSPEQQAEANPDGADYQRIVLNHFLQVARRMRYEIPGAW